MADQLDELVEQLKEAHRDNLLSVVLYGSAASENGNRGESTDKNILVVLERIAPSDLRQANQAALDWRKLGNPLPIYFTREEIEDSADVFPIEFLDLSHARQILYGRDPFEKLDIPKRNLRHQLEYELRGKLIRLRALYIPTSQNTVRLARLMHDSLMTFAVLFRHIISLLGKEPPADKRECALRLAEILNIDKKILARIFEYSNEDALPIHAEVDRTFAAYLSSIEQIIEAVDHLPVESA